MTDYEKAEMNAAIESARNGKDERDAWGTWHEMIATVVWQAARAYEPPTVCGALRNANNVCALTEGHDGDHRAPLHLGGYFGWPREQEPEKLCVDVCQYEYSTADGKTICGLTRAHHAVNGSYGFVAAAPSEAR